MGRGAGDLDHVSQAWPAGMAWPRAPSKFAMYRKTISCWRLPGARPGWLAWPGRARHQHSLCTGRTSSCRKPSFVKGAGPKPGITNLLSTGKPIPCRKPPFVKGAGPGPGIRNLLSTGKPSPCRKLPFVKGARPGRLLDKAPTAPQQCINQKPLHGKVAKTLVFIRVLKKNFMKNTFRKSANLDNK